MTADRAGSCPAPAAERRRGRGRPAGSAPGREGGALEEEPLFGGDDRVDALVVLLRRQWARDELVGVDHREGGDALGPERQHAVVPAAALAQPPSAAVHRQRRHDEGVDLGDGLGRQDLSARLRRSARRPVAQVRRPLETPPGARQVRPQHREQDGDPALLEPVQEEARAGLEAHGDVGGDRVAALDGLERSLGEGLADGIVPGLGVAVVAAAVLAQHLTQAVLGVVDLQPAGVGQVSRVRSHGPILPGRDGSRAVVGAAVHGA